MLLLLLLLFRLLWIFTHSIKGCVDGAVWSIFWVVGAGWGMGEPFRRALWAAFLRVGSCMSVRYTLKRCISKSEEIWGWVRMCVRGCVKRHVIRRVRGCVKEKISTCEEHNTRLLPKQAIHILHPILRQFCPVEGFFLVPPIEQATLTQAIFLIQ